MKKKLFGTSKIFEGNASSSLLEFSWFPDSCHQTVAIREWRPGNTWFYAVLVALDSLALYFGQSRKWLEWFISKSTHIITWLIFLWGLFDHVRSIGFHRYHSSCYWCFPGKWMWNDQMFDLYLSSCLKAFLQRLLSFLLCQIRTKQGGSRADRCKWSHKP